MENILNRSYKLLSGYSMPALGLGTWRLVGVACERIVSQALVIPKAGSVEHLRENMEMDGWELTPEDMRRIDEIGIEMKVVDATYT